MATLLEEFRQNLKDAYVGALPAVPGYTPGKGAVTILPPRVLAARPNPDSGALELVMGNGADVVNDLVGIGGAPAEISIADYGALGDGFTDNSDAFQDAIDAAPENSIITVPQGNYAIGAQGFQLSGKRGVVIEGRGGKITILATSTVPLPGAAASYGVTSIRFVSCIRSGIRQLEIDGNAKPCNVVGFSDCTGCFADENDIHSGGLTGLIVTSGGESNAFRRNELRDSIGTAHGIYGGNVVAGMMESEIAIEGNSAHDNNGDGIVVCSVGGQVTGNQSRDNSAAGIKLGAANGLNAANLLVSGNYCDGNAFHGIQSDAIMMPNQIQNCAFIGNVCVNHSTGGGIYLVQARNCVAANNICADNLIGIAADDHIFGIILSGNFCHDTRAGGARTQQVGIRCNVTNEPSSSLVIVGNRCYNHTQDGINIIQVAAADGIDSLTVNANQCTNNSRYGIFIAEAALYGIDYITLAGNQCNQNTTRDIEVQAADLLAANNIYETQLGLQYLDFADLDATPDVRRRKWFRAVNSGATAITAFDSGCDGQEISITASNANTTINHGGSISNAGAANAALPANGTISYHRRGGTWFETSRSF